MAASTPDKKLLSAQTKGPLFGSQRTVDIKVGLEERNFTVHRDLIRHHSTYFDGALGGNFKESKENMIVLLEDNPDVFELFVHWLYAQRFQPTDPTGLRSSHNMAWLYVFADMRGVLRLKDAVITAFMTILPLSIRHSILREIPYIYANTAEKSLLRKLVVDYVVCDAFQDQKLSDFKSYLTAEFLLEVTMQMKEIVGDRSYFAPQKQRICRYHEHHTGQPCDA